jgi:UDP-N-acetyl-D-mannosaminuronic acid dehydrogenase
MVKKVCVIGLGYIGLPTALLLAKAGYKVLGVDINEKKLKEIDSGEYHLKEKGFDELFREVKNKGDFKVKNCPEEADVFIICVPTPLKRGEKKAELKYVEKATECIIPFIRKGNLVILESTVPPGTTEEVVIPILEKSGLKAKKDFYVVHSPERVLPGNLLQELVNNDRVIGGIDERSSVLAKQLYESFVKGRIYITDAKTAETVKLMENTYRYVNIALANEFAKICLKLGINVWKAIELANKHPRVNIHAPGPGVGGHCIPIDPWFLYEKAPAEAKLIEEAGRINEEMHERIIAQVHKVVPEEGKIAVFGVTYKENVGDVRESVASKIISKLIESGFVVSVHDPFAENFHYPLSSFEDALKGADCAIFLNRHEPYLKLTPENFKLMRGNVIIDCKNLFDEEVFKNSGLTLIKLGAHI